MEGLAILADRSLPTILREHPFTRDLPPLLLDAVAGCSCKCAIPAGNYLWRQGGNADFFYLICTGCAALEIAIPHEGVLRLENVCDGEVLGWYWMLPATRWNVDAKATTPIDAVRVDGRQLRAACEENEALHHCLLERFNAVLARRLLSVQSRLIQAVS
jgi:hypothetical protein